MSTIDREIHLVPSTKHVLQFGGHFGYLHTKFKICYIYAFYVNMKHYSDPRTDEELRLEYRDVAGTFKSEQGFSITSKPMIEARRKVFKVRYKVDYSQMTLQVSYKGEDTPCCSLKCALVLVLIERCCGEIVMETTKSVQSGFSVNFVLCVFSATTPYPAC